jgi:integrase
LAPDESQRFLQAAKKFYPEYYPLLLCALGAGLRQGELLGLKWGDILFGQNESDTNRYILVERSLQAGLLTSTKTLKRRRVDLPRELRQVMLELRDSKFLMALQRDLDPENELIFQNEQARALDRNVRTRVFKCCLARAGLREIRFHDLRHTFGSQLIQNGASLVYVRDQLGHPSIRVTADIYGHLLPSANVHVVDPLDAPTTPPESATQTTLQGEEMQASC